VVRRRFVPMAVVISIVSILLVACGGGTTPAPATPQPASPPPPPPAVAPVAPSAHTGSAPSGASGSQFEVTLADPGGSGTYSFDPTDMTFDVGETVTLALNAESEFHTFTVDGLGIDESVGGGESTSLTFTFDTAGTFDLICVPHEALGMVGTITVK
jgi:plastocyanin